MSNERDIVTDTQLQGLSKLARTYSAGEVICVEGEPSRDLLLLLQGSLDVIQGDNVINTIRGRQVFLGQISFFNAQRRTATLRAKTRCNIVRIREERVEQLLASMPSLALRLIRDLTEMFVQKEQELSRYQEYGTSAHLALQAEGLASILNDYLPALLIALLQDVSPQARLAVANALLDALPKRFDLASMTMSRSSIPSKLNRDTRKQLEVGLLELIKEKTDGASGAAELSGSSLAQMPKATEALETLQRSAEGILVEDVSLGAENETKALLSAVEDVNDALSSKQITESIEIAASIEDHANQVARYARLQKGSETARQLSRQLVLTAGELKSILGSFKRTDKDGALRQELLKNMRFEL